MKQHPVTTVDKMRAMPWLYGFSAGNIMFCLLTVFGPVFPLFLSSLGLPKLKIGFIISLIPFFGMVSLVLSRWVMRVGPKKIFLFFYGLRKIFIGLLLLAPWMMGRFGVNIVFFWVAGLILLFALCRGIAETGWIPWEQEFIPNRVRGRIGAANAIITGVVAVMVSLSASLAVKHVAGLNGYVLLIGVGVMVGMVSVAAMGSVPGGRPIHVDEVKTAFWREMLIPLRDQNFRYYLGGLALGNLGYGFLPFLPIFLKDQVGLGSDKILILDAVMRGGVLGSSYLWGWSVDRFGGKPVLMSGLIMVILFPLILMFMPREYAGSLTWVVPAYLLIGLGSQGYGAGTNRYFYVRAVPPENRNPSYYSINYACLSFFSAIGPLGSGWLLDLDRSLSGHRWGVSVDAFTLLFVLSSVLLITSVGLFHRLRNDGPVRTGEFIRMFIQGNPLLAFESMVRYHLASNEERRISTTEQMGQAKNPLTVDDLLEALSDPSFNVRYEAVVSAAHMPPHPKLIDALIDILRRKEPDLSVAAGWALGRIGDRRAIPALREMLLSEYALLRSRSARSLANLRDADSVPMLLAAFKNEKHDGIRVAYASALGIFRAVQALDEILALLRRLPEESLRDEVALALARMVGGEHHYIRLWHATRSDFGTAGAEALLGLSKKMIGLPFPIQSMKASLDECVQHLADQSLDSAAAVLCRMIGGLPLALFESNLRKVLRECGARLEEFKGSRKEYILLALNALETGIVMIRRRRVSDKK